MKGPRASVGAELVPLVLTLACLAGSLALIVSAHRRKGPGRPVAPAVAITFAPSPPKPAPVPRPAPPPATPPAVADEPEPPPLPVPEDPTPRVVAKLTSAEAEQLLETSRADRKAAALEEARRAAVAESERWRRRESLVHAQLDSLDGKVRRIEADVDAMALERDALEKERDARKAAAARGRSRPGRAILPHKGPNGTWRRPIVIECRNGTAVLQPKGTEFGLLDLESGFGPSSNPFVAAVAREAIRVHAKASPDGEPVVPYIFFVVRPDGIRPYYEARGRLEPLGITFGYELADQDWEIEFPDLDDVATWDGSAPRRPGDDLAANPAPGGGGGGGSPAEDADVPAWPSPRRGGGQAGGEFAWPSKSRFLGGARGTKPGDTGETGGNGPLPGGDGTAEGPPPGYPGYPGDLGSEVDRPGQGGGRPGGDRPASKGRTGPGGQAAAEHASQAGGAGDERRNSSVQEKPVGRAASPARSVPGQAGLPAPPDRSPDASLVEGSDPIATRRPGEMATGGGPMAESGDAGGGSDPGVAFVWPKDGTGGKRGEQRTTAAMMGEGPGPSPRSPATANEDDPGGGPAASPADREARPDGSGNAGSGGGRLAKRMLGQGGTPGGSPPSVATPPPSPMRLGLGMPSPPSTPAGLPPASTPIPSPRALPALPALPEPGPKVVDRTFEVVVVCGSRGVVVQPGGYRVTSDALRDRDGLFKKQIVGLVKARRSADPKVTVEPKIRFLVQPGGFATYRAARAQFLLSGLDWPASFHVADPDPLAVLPSEGW